MKQTILTALLSLVALTSYTARGRYHQLLKRCPQVVQMLSLKDIASFLNVHPNTISKIRRGITFDNGK